MCDYPDKFRYVHNTNYTDAIVRYDITSFDIPQKKKKKLVGIGL
jgi:hypothetical protein